MRGIVIGLLLASVFVLLSLTLLMKQLIGNGSSLLQSSALRFKFFTGVHIFALLMLLYRFRINNYETFSCIIWLFYYSMGNVAIISLSEVVVKLQEFPEEFHQTFSKNHFLEQSLLNFYFLVFLYSLLGFFSCTFFIIFAKLLLYMQQRQITNALQNSLHKEEYSEKFKNEQCAICLQQYTEASQLVRLRCNHVFHRQCITDWIRFNRTCPNDRISVLND